MLRIHIELFKDINALSKQNLNHNTQTKSKFNVFDCISNFKKKIFTCVDSYKLFVIFEMANYVIYHIIENYENLQLHCMF